MEKTILIALHVLQRIGKDNCRGRSHLEGKDKV